MFQKPSVQTTVIPTINLINLGSDKKVRKGSFNFVPLFHVTKEGPEGVESLSLEQIQEGIFGWFNYQLRTKGEEPGKITTKKVYWMDTKLRAGKENATLSDPGMTLGLGDFDKNGNTIPNKQRKNIQGFGVPGLNFQDPDAYKATVRVPVIWNVTANNDVEGNVDASSGQLALLELKENQFKELVEVMNLVTKPGVTYEYYAGKEAKTDKYPYNGYGYAYNINKDADRGMETYKWTKTDMTVKKSMWEEALPKAVKLFKDYVDNAFKVGRPYEDVIQECMDGKIPFEEAEKIVVAIIAKKLLDAWGVSYGDTTDDILATFHEVLPNFSYHAGAGISTVGTGIKRVEIPEETDGDSSDPF